MSARKSEGIRLMTICENISELTSRLALYAADRTPLISPSDAEQRNAADGIVYGLFKVLEEAYVLDEETTERMPEVDWAALHGMRNILAHAYGEVDIHVILNTIDRDMPILYNACARLINS